MFLHKLLLRLIATTTTAAFLVLPAPLCAQTATSPATAEKQTTPQSAKKKVATPKPVAAKGFELEPKAVEILKATSARLSGAHTLSFTANDRAGHSRIAESGEWKVTLGLGQYDGSVQLQTPMVVSILLLGFVTRLCAQDLGPAATPPVLTISKP